MREPARLLRGDATDFERELLEAVKDERPSPELTLRMQRALGIAAPGSFDAEPQAGAEGATQLGGAGSNTSVVTAAGKAAHAGLWLKVGAGAVAVAGLVGAGVALRARASNRDAPSAARAVQQASAPREQSAQVVPGARGQDTAPSGAAVDETLREEIVLLDAARSALGAGNSAQAREVLQRYFERFPRGGLSREANVLWSRLGPDATRVRAPGPRAVSPEEGGPR